MKKNFLIAASFLLITAFTPKFVKKYCNIAPIIVDAYKDWVSPTMKLSLCEVWNFRGPG